MGTLDLVHLDNNEAAVSLCACIFHERPREVFLVVGTAQDLRLAPRRFSAGFLRVYRLGDGSSLQFVHKVSAPTGRSPPLDRPTDRLAGWLQTQVEDVPSALCAFQGRLLAGVGNAPRIYDLGKRKMLRKCENKVPPEPLRPSAPD